MASELCTRCGTGRLASFRYCRSCGFDFEPALHSLQYAASPPTVFEWAAARREQERSNAAPEIVPAASPPTGPPRPAINVPVEVRLALIIGVVAGLGAVLIMGALTG